MHACSPFLISFRSQFEKKPSSVHVSLFVHFVLEQNAEKEELMLLFGRPIHVLVIEIQIDTKSITYITTGSWAQRLINLEIPVLVRSLKSSNVGLG